MSVKAVFVYEDGTVGLVELKQEVSVYSRPLPVPVAAISAVASMPLSIPRIDYERRGRMFDGRPVYCAPGFDVKEAAIVSLCVPHDVENIDKKQRWDARKFVEKEHGNVIPLDNWEGDAAQPHEAEELRATNLLKRGARFLCAVRC